MLSYKPWSLLACAVAGFVHTLAEPASALSCEEPGVIAPLWDATDVPTNTLVWCSGAADAAFDVHVTDSQGEPVSGTQTWISTRNFRLAAFRPSAALAPQTEYRVACRSEYDVRSFTTGAGPRQAPPALPDLTNLSVRSRADDGWGPSFNALFERVSAEGTIVVLDLAGDAQLEPAALTGSIADARLMRSPQDALSVGTGPCLHNWPGAQPGASTQLRLGAFDVTGAFSGWTTPITVTLPGELEGEEKPEEDVKPIALPTPPSEEVDGNAPDRNTPDRNAQTSIDDSRSPTTDVLQSDLASDSVATQPRQSGGCQLGATRYGSWAMAGWLAALACITARRRRHAQ